MKKLLRVLAVLAVLAAVAGGILFAVYRSKIEQIGTLVKFSKQQMQIGRTYIDSIDEQKCYEWIERTRGLISKYGPAGSPIELVDSSLPDDLKAIGLVRVDIEEDGVRYVWMGGMDHTNLYVRKNNSNEFEIFANYDDATSESKLWPK
jgi:hypothetical protein